MVSDKEVWIAYSVFNFMTKKYVSQYKGDSSKFYTDKKAAKHWASMSAHWEVHTFEIRRVLNE